jgi:peptidoglycan/xylan/chitin deacetylase (PgdA/CDA1 family)
MNRKLILLCIALALSLGACKKLPQLFHRKTAEKSETKTEAVSESVAAASPASEAAAAAPPAPPAEHPKPTPGKSSNPHAAVVALCYHNIEDSSGMKALTITTGEFRRELQAIKDAGFAVIGMQDFLAWRRGEKEIPAKCALITIDDGWVSGYTNAWPILKEFGYPFTLFIYVNYIGSGGKSLSWDQLAEMRDAGVDIQCHTYSHSNLRSPGGGVDRRTQEMVKKDVAALGVDGWLRKEIVESKKTIETQLGIKVNAFAYPFGIYSAKAREVVKEAGYEGAFTVYGQQLRSNAPPWDLLGRYAVEAAKPQIFQAALSMSGGGVVGAPEAPVSNVAQLAAASMLTKPAEGETVRDPKPVIKANLATMGDIDPKSVEMRISGFGLVPAKFDPATRTVTYQVTEPLRDRNYTVILSAKAGGKRVETRWTFNFEPGSAPAPVR